MRFVDQEMRDGSLSFERFCVEAELLQRRSHELASKQEVGTMKCVATWEWRHGNRKHLDGDSYLVSSGNAQRYYPDAKDELAKLDKEMEKGNDELLIEEVWSSHSEDQTTSQPQEGRTALLEFHIVYHTIYQTPVLYFRAFAIDGTPLPVEAVTRGIDFAGSSGRPAFVAMEEHPVLGEPFSFLHPCETAAAMQLLQAQVQSDADSRASSEIEVPRYLASWLSLVQPLTRISPLDYYSL